MDELNNMLQVAGCVMNSLDKEKLAFNLVWE